METTDVLDTLEVIKFETPVDKIINQLKQLIIQGHLKPGDRLPAERLLAEKFGVGRGFIREAIMKLEFYGLLKTSPQSGTYVLGFSLKIMDRIFSHIIKFNKDDFNALLEGRYYLEINAVRLSALRRTEQDITEMKEALSEFDKKYYDNINSVDDDMLFHIKIARATHNSFVESMLLLIVPDLIRYINDEKTTNKEQIFTSLNQHHTILNAIIRQDANAAEDAMKEHLKSSYYIY